MRPIQNVIQNIDEERLLTHLKQQCFHDFIVVQKEIFGEKQKSEVLCNPKISGKQVPHISSRGKRSPGR